jgi:hypothetical protein
MEAGMRVKVGQTGSSCAFALAALLGSGLAEAEPLHAVRQNGNPANRVDIVILGDGYTAAGLQHYGADVEALTTALFSQEPFRAYQRYFNVHRIDVVSAQSGSDHPASGVWRDTALQSTYDCAGVTRLICVDQGAVNDVLVRSVSSDSRDIIVVLVNDPEYGGSGGAVAVGSVHPAVAEIMLHELGHTLGLLADEYDTDSDRCTTGWEPSAANVTIATDRRRIKWSKWILAATPVPTETFDAGVPGLYEGADYCPRGKYRPTYDSKMRSLDRPFEQINTEALTKHVYDFVSPIDEVVRQTVWDGTAPAEVLKVRTPRPLTHKLQVRWFVDGKLASVTSTLILQAGPLTPGAHHVQLTVFDPTTFVRNDPEKVLQESSSWDVSVAAAYVREAVPSVADVYVRAGIWHRTNFASTPTLESKLGTFEVNTRESYLKFDISRVNAGDRVLLRLYARLSAAADGGVRTGVHAVSDTSWDENTVTWKTRPAAGALLGTLAVNGIAAQWVEVEITAFVQSQRAAGHQIVSLALRNAIRTTPYAVFNSRRMAGSHPELVILHK